MHHCCSSVFILVAACRPVCTLARCARCRNECQNQVFFGTIVGKAIIESWNDLTKIFLVENSLKSIFTWQHRVFFIALHQLLLRLRLKSLTWKKRIGQKTLTLGLSEKVFFTFATFWMNHFRGICSLGFFLYKNESNIPISVTNEHWWSLLKHLNFVNLYSL